ncbi:MAG TPA: CotH kinase family protein, partial [Planctomycetota bacterium]|nr:CotH kinase family protein [Planctomycetota bacterium]
LSRSARSDVVINELFYNPPEGSALEFIELHNTDPQPVPIAGWSFTEGITFEFPEGTVIEGNGFLLVAQNREEVIRRFGLPEGAVLGDYAGSLDNGGERLTLVDLDGVVVESLRYDDEPPWDVDADGAGPSLERVCASFEADHPANWNSERLSEPTPLLPSRLVQCPPPALPPPRIAINEIHYHPLGDKDATEEFIELKNNTAEPVNLRNYAFTAGITFTFLEDTVLAPGALLVVARDREHLQAAYEVGNVVGNFVGQLSNDGERVTLVDPSGNYVDSVRYYDKGDWPVAADGLGYSLEKILSTAPSDDPASWKEAGVGDLSQWRRGRVAGIATSSRLLVTLDGEGEFLIDNVTLIDPANPGANFIPNATFDAGIESWVAKGNHADTIWDPAGGPDGSGALRIVSRGRGTGATNGIALESVPDLVRVGGPMYEFSFDYKYVTGATGLFVRLSGATVTRGIYFRLGEGPIFSPGAVNTSASEHIPPFVSRVMRLSREPGSGEPVTITARARAEGGLTSLKLFYKVNATGDAIPVDLVDDGAHEDGLAGDGVYGGTIPGLPHNTIVTFTIEAVDTAGAVSTSPPGSDPTGVHGYYVNDEKPDSPFPTYTLLMNHTTATPPRNILRALDCVTWRPASLAWRGDLYYNIGLRRRGGSVCGDPNVIKPYLKVRFQRGRELEGLRKLNFQSLWTDKSLIREKISWEVFRDVGMPDCFEYYVRLHANGQYFGLYGALEHPDKRFLERNRLNPDGNLYKATASREEINGTYEKKTNENGDMTDLRTFLTALNTTPSNQLKAFFTDNVDADRVIDYQLAQTLTNNADYPHKNHYLYHDVERGRWMPLAWDMDLTFGKLWDGN